MPPIRRTNIGLRNRNARRLARFRASQTPQQSAEANEQLRERMSVIRTRRTTEEEAEAQVYTEQQHDCNLRRQITLNANSRGRQSAVNVELYRAAFQYNCTIDYSKLPCLTIGPMDLLCQYCKALKFHSETPGLCCAGGKVKLPPLTPPPEPLRSLLTGDSPEAGHFLTHVQKYNSCFQMTSFGANIVAERGFNPTFKVLFNKSYFRQWGHNLSKH